MISALKRVFKMSYRDICFSLQTVRVFVEDVIHSENVKLTVNKTRWQSGGQADVFYYFLYQEI